MHRLMACSLQALMNSAGELASIAFVGLISVACVGHTTAQESEVASGQPPAALTVPCDPADRAFVCVERNPGDLVRLPKTPWIVASHVNWAFSGGIMTFGFGPLDAIRLDTHEIHRLFPTPQAVVDWDRRTYPNCSAPPASLSSGGLNIRRLGPQEFRLYVVNHGGRESVEIIDLQVKTRKLVATWRGCILTPGGARAGSVVPLEGGRVAVSLHSGAGPAIWTPVEGWAKVEGVGEYDHGIEVSRDGEWLFLAFHRRTGAVIRIPVRGGAAQTIFRSDFTVNSLRWGEDGRLYATGFFHEGVKECLDSSTTVCDVGFVIVQIDPDTLISKEVLRTNGIKGAFGAATTAVQIGKQFWVGTWFGDRIAILTRKE